MKYLKTFETHKDKYRQKQKLNNSINEYVPGAYVVFYKTFFSWEHKKDNNFLFIGRINHADLYNTEEVGVYIDIIDFDSEIFSPTFKSPNVFNIERNFEKVIISNSLKTAQDKYDELSEQMEITKQSNKYNL